MGWFDFPGNPGQADENVQLPVVRKNQETNMWCWAASGEMLMSFQGVDVAQCDQANNRFGMTVCCQSPVPNACVQGGWPEFSRYGFNSQRTSNAPLSWSQLVDQIGNKRLPIAFTWAWTGGGGHMMVIFGYAVLGGIKYVHVHDPWPPSVGATRMITYDAYVAGPGYSHWDDFYDVQRAFTPGGPGAMSDDVPGQREALSLAMVEASRALPIMKRFLSSNAPGAADEPMALGKGIAVSFLGLDELKSIGTTGPGAADQRSLLDRTPSQVIYSVTGADNAVKAEVTVSQSGKTWRQSGFGSPSLCVQVKRAQGGPGSNDAVVAERDAAVISVPALNQQFLVLSEPGGKFYVPLIEDRVAGFYVTQKLTATELLEQLAHAAAAHDNLPH